MKPGDRKPAVRTTLLLALLVTGGLALPRPGPTEGQPEGGALFDRDCVKCHGQDGQAKTFRGFLIGAANLADGKWQAEETDGEIAEAIRKGPGLMPAFESKLSPPEVEALVAHVRGLKRD